MSISFIAIHSRILKYVAPWGQNTLRGALYPTLPYLWPFASVEHMAASDFWREINQQQPLLHSLALWLVRNFWCSETCSNSTFIQSL